MKFGFHHALITGEFQHKGIVALEVLPDSQTPIPKTSVAAVTTKRKFGIVAVTTGALPLGPRKHLYRFETELCVRRVASNLGKKPNETELGSPSKRCRGTPPGRARTEVPGPAAPRLARRNIPLEGPKRI